MNKPLVQIALDTNTIGEAIDLLLTIHTDIDIIEVGTVLCLSNGMKAVETISYMFPNKTILADTKCADAGKVVSKNCKIAGANWMTVICSATLPTMAYALDIMEDIQIELYGNWTFEDAKNWKEMGITQVVYHQSRDALLYGEAWGQKDLKKIKKLIEMGFKVSVTGGLSVESIELFKELDVFCFIFGRGIKDSVSPSKTIQKIRKEINKYW